MCTILTNPLEAVGIDEVSKRTNSECSGSSTLVLRRLRSISQDDQHSSTVNNLSRCHSGLHGHGVHADTQDGKRGKACRCLPLGLRLGSRTSHSKICLQACSKEAASMYFPPLVTAHAYAR